MGSVEKNQSEFKRGNKKYIVLKFSDGTDTLDFLCYNNGSYVEPYFALLAVNGVEHHPYGGGGRKFTCSEKSMPVLLAKVEKKANDWFANGKKTDLVFGSL